MDTHDVPCLCGSSIDYQQCCEPYHTGEKTPATAEALMRSRYTAYALRNGAYLQATWEAAKRPKTIDFSRENVDWLRLEVTETKKGGISDNKGVVGFKAFYNQDGEAYVLKETSRFVKTGGRWFYLDGAGSISKAAAPEQQGRNALCPCGSGKKFKRCCGAG